MKLKQLFAFLILISSCSQAQNASKCRCEFLKQSEENDKKVVALAQEIERSFDSLKIDAFENKFDKAGFYENILGSEIIDENDEFTQGFIKGINKFDTTLGNRILSLIKNGDYYTFINFHYNIEYGAYYFTFRLFSESSGVNYHDYKVCYNGKDVKFNDLYIYLTGEHLSETMKRMYIASKPNDSRMLKMLGVRKKSGALSFLQAKKFADKGNYKAAYKLLDNIEGELANEKFIQIMKSMYASAIDDELYEKALKTFAELYPNDPTLYLKQIDYYILKENYKLALENIDKLIFETEDDFLNYLKANTYLAALDFKNAQKYYNYMVENYPSFFQGYSGLMVAHTNLKAYDKAINVANLLIEQGYEKKLLAEFIEEKEADGSNALKNLVKSKAYTNWKKQK